MPSIMFNWAVVDCISNCLEIPALRDSVYTDWWKD